MAYVGKHENITNLIGACTENLRQGMLYILVELCSNGSLEEFLHENKQSFNDRLVVTSNCIEVQTPYIPLELLSIFGTEDLLRWASQVAAGMAHLSSKQVIHGDLSARNILLDENRTAKLCDFGLSHRLYTSTIYRARAESSLPWKWTAVEVLLEGSLSLKSDVWSFGVTMWEMFTLGESPYADLQWSPAFTYFLSSTGCPLKKPKCANLEIFQIMMQCWAIEPENRPTFKELQTRLKQIQHAFQEIISDIDI